MNDLPPAPKRPSPQQGRPRPRPGAKPPARKSGKMTEQQKLIGYGVLGAGVLLMLVVGWAVFTRMPDSGKAPVAQEKSVQVSPAVALAPKQAEKTAREKLGRVSEVSEKQLSGTWSSQFGDMNTIFQIGDGTYQILAARSKGSPSHYYSRGTYTLKNNLLTLTPVHTMGAPKSDDPKIRYTRLAGRPFTVDAGLSREQLIWLPGPADPDFPDRTTLHPLIRMSGGEMVVWQRMKD